MQQLGAGEEDAGQLHPPALAARQHADRPGRRGPGAGRGRRGGAAPRTRRRSRPACSKASWARDHLATARVVARSLLHGHAGLLHADGELVEAPAAEHPADRRDVVGHAVEAGILGEVAERGRAVHGAGLRLGHAAEHLQERRLAGAVATDQADGVTGADGEGGALHHEGRPHLHREVPDGQHDPPCVPSPPNRMCGGFRAGARKITAGSARAAASTPHAGGDEPRPTHPAGSSRSSSTTSPRTAAVAGSARVRVGRAPHAHVRRAPGEQRVGHERRSRRRARRPSPARRARQPPDARRRAATGDEQERRRRRGRRRRPRSDGWSSRRRADAAT